MDNDKDLDLITAKKMMALRRRLVTEKPKEKTDRDILLEKLVDRGSEVLEIAEQTYSKQTEIIVKKLAALIKDGSIAGYVSGGELLGLFRALRLPLRVETRIAIEKGGKLVSLQDKLKSGD